MNYYESMIGTTLGERYLLISIIGMGGMAVVFNAYDRVSGETVAVKVLKEDDVEDPSDSPSIRKQFIKEAHTLSVLSHPSIVKYKDACLDGQLLYFVMEYVDGITLKEYLHRNKILSVPEILNFSGQILSALAHIHAKGFVHCDIKPHNILLMRNGRVKLTDFGIARMAGEKADLPKDKAVGTVYYVSPEQAEGKALDHRSDLYSLGITMYQMATGRLPFNSREIDKVAKMQSLAQPKQPRALNPEIPRGLEQIILKAMAKKPYLRFSCAEEMKRYIEQLKKNPSAVFRLQTASSASVLNASGTYRPRSAYAVLAGVIAAFVLVVSIALPTIYTSIFRGADGQSFRLSIPDVRGSNADEATSKLDARYFDVNVIYNYHSDRIPGLVLAQEPQAGTRVTAGGDNDKIRITLTVSAKERTLTMIDVLALSPESAEAYLQREGYSVKFETSYDDVVPQGYVCGSFPQAGEPVQSGSEVTVYISLGANVAPVSMPSFLGLSESEATKKLQELHLRVGAVKYRASVDPVGTVIGQSLAEGTSVYPGTAVDFTVSGGPDYRA